MIIYSILLKNELWVFFATLPLCYTRSVNHIATCQCFIGVVPAAGNKCAHVTTNLMSWRLWYSGWCAWWLITGLAWCCGGGRTRCSWRECGWEGWGWGWGGALSRGGVGTGGGGCCSFFTLTGGGVGMRELGGLRGAAAAAGAGEPVGAEAGVGLGTGGVKGTSLLLCSWLRWRPDTLAEL